MASTKSTKSSSETRNTNSGNSSSKCVTNSSYVKKPTPEKVGRRYCHSLPSSLSPFRLKAYSWLGQHLRPSMSPDDSE